MRPSEPRARPEKRPTTTAQATMRFSASRVRHRMKHANAQLRAIERMLNAILVRKGSCVLAAIAKRGG